MNDKVVLAIIAALGGGVFTLISTYLTGRIKIRQLEFERILRHSSARLAAAHEKLGEVYVPIMSQIEVCYHSWYVWSLDHTNDKKDVFIANIEALNLTYLNLIKEGNSIYLLPQAHEELERLTRFLVQSKQTDITKYLIITRMEGIGLRSVVEHEYNTYFAFPVYLGFVFLKFISKYVRWFDYIIQTNVSLRVHSAPIDSDDFSSEFRTMLDILRSISNEVALSKYLQNDDKTVTV